MKLITSGFFIPTVLSGAASGGGSNWILAAGIWNDSGVWDDTANWKDS